MVEQELRQNSEYQNQLNLFDMLMSDSDENEANNFSDIYLSISDDGAKESENKSEESFEDSHPKKVFVDQNKSMLTSSMLDENNISIFHPIIKVENNDVESESDGMVYESNTRLLKTDLSQILFNVDPNQE